MSDKNPTKRFIGIVSLFPEAFTALTSYGVVGRALREEAVQLEFFNPRDYTTDKHRTVDEQPYGGGQGMLLKYAPLAAALDHAKASASKGDFASPRVVYLSPQGRQLNQSIGASYSKETSLILLAGCYEGIDERIVSAYVDEELSIGDYILSGGELAAMVFMNSVARLWEDCLGNPQSAKFESFQDGLLEEPQYTRPSEIMADARGKFARDEVNLKVPPVLCKGNHKDIKEWKKGQSLVRTWQKRPDLLSKTKLSPNEQKLLLLSN
ncbi:MAG: tRNA (guanosine(37)-N1)-methyltransferase TrmD [Candidatus Portiera sp.]|nr:tRNA (guanosine(37)-N1)-methyltransferase TrmD [Portiera sp.]